MPSPEGNHQTGKRGLASCDTAALARQCIAAQVLGEVMSA